MTDDRDIQHPDITEALRTGYPRRFPNHDQDRETVEREFIEENEDGFLLFCMARREIVEDYLAEHQDEFREFKWSTYGEVAY